MKRIVCLFLMLALVLCACGKKTENTATWQEQYDLGVRYLSEGNYKEAILAFEAAIEIDPKQADAYVALADAYLSSGSYDKAAEVLDQGRDACGDLDAFARIEQSADLLQSGETGIRITEFYFDKAAYLAGQSTEFLVSVAYRCPEDVDCILMIGANTDKPGSFHMLDEDFAVSGSGGYQFKVNVTPVQWENALFGIYVNLSEADHGATWTPFAADTMYIDAQGNLSRETTWQPGGADGEYNPEDDPYMLLYNMLQREGALTYADLPELFTTPYNQLSGLLGRMYAEGGEFTSEQTGGYGIQVDGEYQSVDYTLPVQYCGYLGEDHSYVQASAPVGDSRLLDISIQDTSGSAGWRGIQMGDSYAMVLEKLGLDSELLQDYYGVSVLIFSDQEMNSGWITEETDSYTARRYVNVDFSESADNYSNADYNITFVFEDGEYLAFVSYSNFGLLVELTSGSGGSAQAGSTKETANGLFGEVWSDDGRRMLVYENGLRIKEVVYSDDGQLAREEYYEDDRLIKEIWYNYGYHYTVDERLYDKDGNLLSHHKYVDHENMSADLYEYDEEGRKTQYIYYAGQGAEWLLDYHVWYDKQENIVKETYYDRDTGKVESYREYERDVDGYSEKVSEFDETGNLLEINWYDYQGNRVKQRIPSYNGNGTGWLYVYYEYNDSGNQIDSRWEMARDIE